MSQLINWIIISIKYILSHWGKIVSTVVIFIIFIFLFFPFNEVNDLVSSKVSELTNKTVYLQFEDLSINPIILKMSLDKVTVDTKSIDNLTIQNLSLKPSITGLIKQQPFGELSTEGIFGGSINLNISSLGSNKSSIHLEVEKIALKDLRKAFKIKFPFIGQLQLQSKVQADLNFEEQPDGDLNLTITPFQINSYNLQTDSGPIGIPEIKFNKIDLKAKISGGKISIESAKIGQSSDELYGTLKGDIIFKMTKNKDSGSITPEFGQYALELDLVAKPSFIEKAGFYLTLLDQYKTQEQENSRYKIKLFGQNFESTPSLSRQ